MFVVLLLGVFLTHDLVAENIEEMEIEWDFRSRKKIDSAKSTSCVRFG